MLRKAEALHKYTLGAVDGEIGKVKDVYFDDQHWTVRYLVADTGNWLEERPVLISPYALVSVDEEREIIATNLTRKQIENSPPAESDKPVSRQFEVIYYEYYQWPVYWSGPYAWGAHPYPVPLRERAKEVEEASWDSHLRSVREVAGYGVGAADGEIGHIADFIIDDKDWAIRYLVVDTRNWWPGKHVLMVPQWIERVSWDDRTVYVDLTRDTIKDAPEYPAGFRHLSRVRDRTRSPLQSGGLLGPKGRRLRDSVILTGSSQPSRDAACSQSTFWRGDRLRHERPFDCLLGRLQCDAEPLDACRIAGFIEPYSCNADARVILRCQPRKDVELTEVAG